MSTTRKPGPQPRYTRDQVAERALALMDAHGPGRLTMRQLAADLGMSAMALYRYFPHREALIDAAIEVASPEVTLPEPGAAPWKQQLADLARQLYQAGVRHPTIALERFSRPLQSPSAMKVTDLAIALLLEAGLAERDAVAAFKSLLIHVFGAAVITASESGRAVRRSASHVHQAVPADLFPAMALVAAELDAALGSDSAFELGLIMLLDGVERHAATTTAHRSDLPAPQA
ncbi:MAG TPA: TetR/AcrR family transcriptional regulator [Streptosporangiaceae bacterium]|jgi:AcrR family transcriptional regulator